MDILEHIEVIRLVVLLTPCDMTSINVVSYIYSRHLVSIFAHVTTSLRIQLAVVSEEHNFCKIMLSKGC
jgi:hypothetical protein